jgi:hypothetical protein
MKTTYTATAADGRTFTRTSAREFTHAAIVWFPWMAEDGTSRVYTKVSFSSSLEGARKLGKTPDRFADVTTIEIVEVTA